MQGGNGVGGTFGNTMDNFIQTLQRRGDIISGSATEIWNLKESLEKEGMTAEEKSSATQKLIDKLGEMGVTSEQATQAFETLRQKGSLQRICLISCQNPLKHSAVIQPTWQVRLILEARVLRNLTMI